MKKKKKKKKKKKPLSISSRILGLLTPKSAWTRSVQARSYTGSAKQYLLI
jgi:hypothetical protein